MAQGVLIPSSENYQDLPIFVQWMDFLKWLLHTTEKFPKKVRFTFSDRINNLALNVVEELVEARYSGNKRMILKTTNLKLEKLRILLRISYESKFFSHEAYKHAMYALNEVGKMLGGWIKQQDGKA
ncbi:MAG: hypothetical protein JWQ35_1083 [Bacteriovoracaceae bacterium]|nr:hypothetical protein [Bacteriovoracaceae bacterium]